MNPSLQIRDLALEKLREKNDALAARVKELEGRLAWQPIETAPKDGTRILFYDPHTSSLIFAGIWDDKFESDFDGEDTIYRGAWTDYAVASFGFEEYQEYSPTHWQPLPEPPAAVAAKGAE